MTENNKNIILKVSNLSKTFTTVRGKVDAVKDVSFEVEKGKFFGIIGESGSGKTTLGRSIIGLNDTTYGSIYFENELINLKHLPRKKRRWRQRSIQMIFQDPLSSLNEKKNVLSIISEPLRINKESFKEFNEFMKQNDEILVNFRYTLEKTYRTFNYEYIKKELNRAFTAYDRLGTLVSNFLPKLDELSQKDIVDFVEGTYYDILLNENHEVLKEVRKLNSDLNKLYADVQTRYLKNDMEKDEIDLKNAKELVKTIQEERESSDAMDELNAKLNELNEEQLVLSNQLTEMKAFSKSFLKNFAKSLKTAYKDENFKARVTKTNADYALHKDFSSTLKQVYKRFKLFPKGVLLTQEDTDEIYAFRTLFFKLNATNEQRDKGFEKIEKVYARSASKYEEFENKTKKISEKIAKVQEQINKQKEFESGLRVSRETKRIKHELAKIEDQLNNKNEKTLEQIATLDAKIAEQEEKLKELSAQQDPAKVRTQQALIKATMEMEKLVLKREELAPEVRLAKLKDKLTEQEKLDEEAYDNPLEAAQLQLAQAQLVYDEELEKASIEMNEWRAELKQEMHSTISELTKKYTQRKALVLTDFKMIKKALFTKIKAEQISQKQEVIKNLGAKKSTKSIEDTDSIDSVELSWSNKRKALKAAMIEYKLIKQHAKAMFKNNRNKQRSYEIEVNLEKKRIKHTKALFGVVRLPRLLIKKLAKKNYLIQTVYDMLVKVGLKPEHAYRYPHEFSGGQRQRIGIARAIITKPKLIIADEPISALDVSIQAQIINILKSLSIDLGATLLFIAHDLSMVSYICDEVIIMSNGRVLEKGNTSEIFKSPKHPYTRELLSSVPELSNVHKDLAKKLVIDGYEYDPTKEYDFVQVGDLNHFILADDEQAKTWL